MSILMQRCATVLRSTTRNLFGRSQKKLLGDCNLVEIGFVSPELSVPDHISKPDYYHDPEWQGGTPLNHPEIKDATTISQMRISSRLAASILRKCSDLIRIGVTTNDIDGFVHEHILAANAYPSPLRYRGFPKSVCTSVNNVACHGIPDDRPLMNGDIINVDITVFYNGHHGDCSTMFLVGDVDERGRLLVDVARKCRDEAIQCCGPNRPFNAIGNCIERIARQHFLKVVPAFTGHGIGSYFHGPPEILHFRNSIGGLMNPGMVFTIEPVLSLGTEEIEIQEDGWTAMSTDGSRSAQFEHTVLITDDGVEILTEE